MDRERYRKEALRLAVLLRREAQRLGLSIRSLEQKMGVGNSIYQKVLNGKITMTLEYLLQIADAIGLEWPELFRRAYLDSSQPDEALADTEEFDRRVLDVLRRHGLLPDGTATD